MNFYKKIKFKNIHCIINFDLLISLVFLLIVWFAFLVAKTMIAEIYFCSSLCWFVFFALTLPLAIFGNATYLIFAKEKIYFLELFFLLPHLIFQVKKAALNLLENYPKEEKNHLVNIYIGNDPWEEMGFANWVEMQHKGKKYAIGNNKNYEELFAEIKSSVNEIQANNK